MMEIKLNLLLVGLGVAILLLVARDNIGLVLRELLALAGCQP